MNNKLNKLIDDCNSIPLEISFDQLLHGRKGLKSFLTTVNVTSEPIELNDISQFELVGGGIDEELIIKVTTIPQIGYKQRLRLFKYISKHKLKMALFLIYPDDKSIVSYGVINSENLPNIKQRQTSYSWNFHVFDKPIFTTDFIRYSGDSKILKSFKSKLLKTNNVNKTLVW